MRAFLWDVDGVFVDTEVLHFKAWQFLVENAGGYLSETDYAHMVGRGSDENLRAIRERFTLTGTDEELQLARRRRYQELRTEGVPTLGANIKLARELADRFPNAVRAAVSSARRRDIEENLRIAGLDHFFSKVISFEDVPGMGRKPAPDIYEHACRELSVEPSSCVAFEDSGNGVASAVGAGVRAVALPTALTAVHDFSAAALVIPDDGIKDADTVIRGLGLA